MAEKDYEICTERKDQFDSPIIRIKFKDDEKTALKKLKTILKGVENTISNDLGISYHLPEIRKRPENVAKSSYYSSTSHIGIDLNKISKNLWDVSVNFYGVILSAMNSSLEWHIKSDVIDTFYWWKRYN